MVKCWADMFGVLKEKEKSSSKTAHSMSYHNSLILLSWFYGLKKQT